MYIVTDKNDRIVDVFSSIANRSKDWDVPALFFVLQNKRNEILNYNRLTSWVDMDSSGTAFSDNTKLIWCDVDGSKLINHAFSGELKDSYSGVLFTSNVIKEYKIYYDEQVSFSKNIIGSKYKNKKLTKLKDKDKIELYDIDNNKLDNLNVFVDEKFFIRIVRSTDGSYISNKNYKILIEPSCPISISDTELDFSYCNYFRIYNKFQLSGHFSLRITSVDNDLEPLVINGRYVNKG